MLLMGESMPVTRIGAASRTGCGSSGRLEQGTGEPATMMELIRVADGRVAELWGLGTLRWR
jgi:hypothetical protein